MNTPLRLELERVARRESSRQWHSRLLVLWSSAALAAAALLALRHAGVPIFWPALAVILASPAAYAILFFRHRKRQPHLRDVALRIEHAHPELHTVLLAALDQKPQDGRFSFLQDRVIFLALDSAQTGDWDDVSPARQITWRRGLQRTAAAAAILLLGWLFVGTVADRITARSIAQALEIQPGNAELERGSPVTFTARFSRNLPAAATLRLVDPSGQTRDLPLSRTLEDPVFTASLPAVNSDLRYRVEFGSGRSEEFTLKVYDPPRVERVDANLKFPAYTGRPAARMEDAHNISAIEQTDLSLQVRTNKPMQAVELRSKDGAIIPLHRSAADASLYETTLKLEKSAEFQVALKDEAGRPNAQPEQLNIKVHANRPPTVKATLPTDGDRATPLQEISFEATVEDDFGLQASGITIQLGTAKPMEISGPPLKPGTRSAKLTRLLKLEDLGAKANDLVMWNAWGEDLGPDGKPRRTNGDIRVMQVRPFDISYRQREGAETQVGESRCLKCIKIQTQILTGTWNVQRDAAPKAPSAGELKTLQDSQRVVIDIARKLEEDYPSPELRQYVKSARSAMETSLERLTGGGVEDLPPAITSEQAALSNLYRLLKNDMDLVLGKKGEPSAGSPPIDELDLKNMTPRYEKQTTGQDELDQKGKEVRETLNRLRDLAHRQRDINDQMNRLQNAIRVAHSDEEQAALDRQLQRLRDQQKELVADMDRARDRMAESKTPDVPQPENQNELEKARQAAERTARKLETKQLGEALAEGTRAQRSLDQLQKSFREATSNQLSGPLSELRAQARELARRQQDLGRQLDEDRDAVSHRTLKPDADSFDARASRQAEDFQKLMETLDNTARLAEESEPIVSRRLDEAARQSNPAGIKNALQAMREGAASNDHEAAQAAQRAGEKSLQALSERIDEAASKVLGNEKETLEYAQAELDNLRRAIAPNSQGMQSPDSTPPNSRQQGQQGQQDNGSSKEAGDSQSGSQSSSRQASDSPTKSGSRSGAGNGGQGEGGGSSREDGSEIFTESGSVQEWSDRLQDLEAAVDLPEARDAMARARSAARELRIDARRHSKPPSHALVEEKVLRPLVEAEIQIRQELNRLDRKNPLSPVERDPVPESYTEIVQRYYESLGQ